jgi:hypothetical protein
MSRDERRRSWPLLVACARHAAGLTDAGEVAAASAAIDDWGATERHASAHGLLPWLARSLSSAGMATGRCAPVIAAASASAARALGQARRLGELWMLLERAGVPALPYQGPALSLQLYGDVALRQSVDLDLLVPFDRYAEAREVLVSHGLAPRGGHSRRQERTLFAWLGHAPFGQGADFVELHWRFADRRFPFALDAERALARARSVVIGGRALPVMADDDLAVVLAMHGARHLYERLEWLAGVTRLLVAHRGEPAHLLAHAQSLRARRMLAASVHVAHHVLDFPLTEDWRRALAVDPDAAALGAAMAHELESYAVRDEPLLQGAALQRRYAALLDARADRVRLYVSAAFDPTVRDQQAVALPDALVPLHRVLRPARLATRYLARTMASRA